MNQAEFLNERWKIHRDEMTAPIAKSRGQVCHNDHHDWDWWIWDGASYDTERSRCGSCNRISRGNPSPWADKAREDWFSTTEYERRQYEHHVRDQRKKIKFDRPGWRRDEIWTSAPQ